MGFDNPIGELVEWGKNASNGTYQVIGVIKDMITNSPFEAVRPMIYVLHYGRFIRFVNLRVNAESGASVALREIENVFKNMTLKIY